MEAVMGDDQDVFKKAGKKGGEARARNLTPEERSEIARNAVKSRWQKAKEENADQAATVSYQFPLREGNAMLTLPNGISAGSVLTLTTSLNLALDGIAAQAEKREGGPMPKDDENRKLATAMHIVFEADCEAVAFDGAARSLLAAVRRCESEMALRQQAAKIQSRLTGRVVDAQCQRIVALAQEVADAHRVDPPARLDEG
jgi:hypothetical protein